MRRALDLMQNMANITSSLVSKSLPIKKQILVSCTFSKRKKIENVLHNET